MQRSRSKKLASQSGNVHFPLPDNPLIPLFQQSGNHLQLRRSKSHRRVRKEARQKAHGVHIRQPVISELRLRSVLVEAPVVLDAFLSAPHNLRHNRITRLFHQVQVILQHPSHHDVACQPHFVLSGHTEAGLLHHRDGILLLGFGQKRFKQDEGSAQRTRNTNLIIVPVQADRLLDKPVAQGPMNGLLHLLRMIMFVFRIAKMLHHLKYPFGMQTRVPSRTVGILIIDVTPRAIGLQRFEVMPHPNRFIRHTLLEFHHHTVGHREARLVLQEQLFQRRLLPFRLYINPVEILPDDRQIAFRLTESLRKDQACAKRKN